MASARLHADSKKLTEDQRIEILRGLSSEYAKIKVVLPAVQEDSGILERRHLGSRRLERRLQRARACRTHRRPDSGDARRNRQGPHRPGTERRDEERQAKFIDHVQIGMGNATTPVTGPATNAPGGTTVALTFGGPIGEVTSADIKKMLLADSRFRERKRHRKLCRYPAGADQGSGQGQEGH